MLALTVNDLQGSVTGRLRWNRRKQADGGSDRHDKFGRQQRGSVSAFAVPRAPLLRRIRRSVRTSPPPAPLRSGRLRAKRFTPDDAAATTEQCVRRLIDVQPRSRRPRARGSATWTGCWPSWLCRRALPANLHDLAACLGLRSRTRAAGGWPTSTGSWTATCPGRLCDGSSRSQASAGRRGRPLSRAQLS